MYLRKRNKGLFIQEVLADKQLSLRKHHAAVAERTKKMLDCMTSRRWSSKTSLSPPTPSLSGYSWDSVFSFGHHYTKNLCTCWKESGEGPQDGSEDLESWRKDWEKWICSVLRKEGSDKTLSPCSCIKRVTTKKMETPFPQGVTCKRCSCYSWGDSNCTQEEIFSQWEQSAIGIIFPLFDSPVLETYKIQKDRVPGHLVKTKKDWIRWSLKFLSNWYFMILWK